MAGTLPPDGGNATAASPSAPVRVVVVEDHEFFRATVTAELRPCDGFEVVGLAGDGGEGLAMVRALDPDVALVDVKLPVLDGLRLCELVAGTRTRVVLMSGFAEDELVEQAERAGAAAFLPKTLTSGGRLRAALLGAAAAPVAARR